MPPSPLRHPVAAGIDPAVAFRALHSTAEHAFWLDAGVHAPGGMSWMGAAESVVTAHSWSELEAAFGHLAPASTATSSVAPGGSRPRFALGWVGWFAYELGTIDAEREGRTRPSEHPVSVFLRIDRAIEFDHTTGSVTLLSLDTPDAHAWFAATERALREVSTRQSPSASVLRPAPQAPSAPLPAVPRHPLADYARLVEECQALIRAGEAYQLCLTNTFDVNLSAQAAPPDPLALYEALRERSPSSHGGFLRAGATTLLSASPEQFLTIAADRTLSTSPVKGTRPRGRDPVEDEQLKAELRASDKEQAENLMIVDLMRNDLARVAELGSVRVSRLLEVESFRHVHQLVSTVEARLAPQWGTLDAVAACFPAGSMTGAPKDSAIRHLAELERGARGVYSGAFGYLSDDGTAELAMVIRSIVLRPGHASIGAGGGITALSVPDDEVDETLLKARVLADVLGAVLPEGPERGVAHPPGSPRA